MSCSVVAPGFKVGKAFTLLAFLVFHIFAGLKHLMLDFHLGDSVAASHRGSIAVIVLTIVATAALGVALW